MKNPSTVSSSSANNIILISLVDVCLVVKNSIIELFNLFDVKIMLVIGNSERNAMKVQVFPCVILGYQTYYINSIKSVV